MSQPKEIPLNGAYYGPPVPPPSQPHPHPKRTRSCICCLISTLLKVILSIIIIIIIAIGIAVLVFWIVWTPAKMKFHVVSADLTKFDLTNGNTLHYNLSLNVAIRNPNKKIRIYYDILEAAASYEGERFGWTTMPNFLADRKSTNNVSANFTGQSMIILRGSEINMFNQAKNAGIYFIDVKVYARIRYRLGDFITGSFKPDAKCHLKIPLASSNGTLATEFKTTRCDVDL